MVKVSLANMRIALRDWDRAWHTWVIADQHGGHMSYWNGRKHPYQHLIQTKQEIQTNRSKA